MANLINSKNRVVRIYSDNHSIDSCNFVDVEYDKNGYVTDIVFITDTTQQNFNYIKDFVSSFVNLMNEKKLLTFSKKSIHDSGYQNSIIFYSELQLASQFGIFHLDVGSKMSVFKDIQVFLNKKSLKTVSIERRPVKQGSVVYLGFQISEPISEFDKCSRTFLTAYRRVKSVYSN